MSVRYYLDWFDESGFSEKLAGVLRQDIGERETLVMVSASPPEDGGVEESAGGAFEVAWFSGAGILFDAYHLIGEGTPKEDAQRLIRNASVIFLCGGNVPYQKRLLMENELPELIRQSNAVVMGTSAGGMNMSEKYVDRYADEKRPGYQKGDVPTQYEGMALDPFSFEAHFDHRDTALIQARFPLSEGIDVYMAADQNGAVRVKDGKIDIIGSVYLIAHSTVRKLAETL